jgi:hypothetical protein
MRAMHRGRQLVVLAALLSTLVLPSAARAHDRLQAGPYVFTLGWEKEPALAGYENGVEVDVAGSAGRPVSQAAGKLALEVSFGDVRMVVPLEPGARAGLFRADLVPTRAGAYTFRILGAVRGRHVDISSTCSDRTFECVIDASEQQFPATDPTSEQLSERIDRLSARTSRATDSASEARTIALAGIVLALIGLLAVASVVVLRRVHASS